MKIRIIIFCLVCMQTFLAGQSEDDDTVINTEQDTSAVQKIHNGFKEVFEGNPGKAAIYGLLYPAGGQVCNRKWWKVPIALGIEGGTIGYLVYTYQRFNFWDQEYKDVAIHGETPKTRLTTPALILKKRNVVRGNREMAWVYFAIGHVFTAFEAYIDRHLIEFDVSDDLTFNTLNSPLGPVPSLTYSIALDNPRKKYAFKYLF